MTNYERVILMGEIRKWVAWTVYAIGAGIVIASVYKVVEVIMTGRLF